MANADANSIPLTCPACGGTAFHPVSTGFLFKSAGMECDLCKTRLRASGKREEKFTVTEVGEGYSNCDRLLSGVAFTRAELAEPDLPVYSDAELIEFGSGDVPEDLIAPDMLEEPPFELEADERVMLQMENVYSWEDRLHPDSPVLQRPTQVKAGEWMQLKPLAEPRYAHNVETLATGRVTITTRRLVFESETRLVNQPYGKAVRVLPFPDGLGLTSPERNRIEYFKGNFHWPLVFSVVKGLHASVASKKVPRAS